MERARLPSSAYEKPRKHRKGADPNFMHTHWDAYRGHRKNAKKGGVEFLLTFEEWLDIWETSGHLHERGCRKGQYVMARYGDQGPYAIGNVRICTVEENHKERMSNPNNQAIMLKSHLGIKSSPETIEKVRKAGLGRIHTPETIEKMREARREWWRRRNSVCPH